MKFQEFLRFIGAPADKGWLQSIWHHLSGENQIAYINGEEVEHGTWRWTGGQLALYLGEGYDYLDFYCGGSGSAYEEVLELFKRLGIVLVPM